MKKFFTALLCAIATVLSVVGFTACSKNPQTITVYAPDGAPAIALAQLMHENPDLGEKVEYNVVNSTTIAQTVSYNDSAKNADLCVLPVNAASKLLGDGEAYQMLGTVTHGNLYLLKRESSLASIDDVEDLSELIGKTVGVIQLNNVPGLTFKAILNNNGIAYGNAEDFSAEQVNLKALADATAVLPSDTTCDYFVVPEPAATSKTALTTLEFAGSLQRLYGGDDGYTQAVLVAKKSLIESKPQFISAFMNAMTDAAEWLLSGVSGETIYAAIDAHYDKATPQFTATQLTAEVISNCAIYFTPSTECKEDVKKFISDLIEVDETSAKAVSDAFFYIPAKS